MSTAENVNVSTSNGLSILLTFAEDAIKSLDYTDAASAVEEVLSLEPTNPDALWLMYRLVFIGTIQMPQDMRYNILQKSAKGLSIPAMLELADLYANGKSKGGKIKMDKAQAAAWYKMAKSCDAELTAEQESVYTQLNAKNTKRADELFNEYRNLL